MTDFLGLDFFEQLYLITAFITAIESVALSIFVFLKNTGSRLHRSYGLFGICVGLWSVSLVCCHLSLDLQQALLWNRLVHFFSVFIAISFYNFILILLQCRGRKVLNVGIMMAVIIGGFCFTPYIISHMSARFGFRIWPSIGSLYLVYLTFFSFYSYYSLFLVFRRFEQESGIKKEQLRYIFIALFIGFVGGSTNFAYSFDLPIPPVGNLFVFLYVLILAYAIVRYRLMDIRVAVASTVILFLVYAFVMGVPFYFFYKQQYLMSLLLMAFFAPFGPFLYLFFQRRANAALLKVQRRYQQTLIQASSGMGHIKDLRKLVKLIVRIIMRALKPDLCAIYVYNKEAEAYDLGANLLKNNAMPLLESVHADAKVVEYMFNEGKPILLDEIKIRAVDKNRVAASAVALEVAGFNAAMLVPSIIDGRMVAFMVLGDKLSGAPYTADDINVFTILANQAALAIENAQFYDEVKRSHEQLYQAEKLAIIGTMADGLAHQINNRFNTLSFIIDDLLDSIKVFQRDPAKLSVEQLIPVLELGFKSMIGNVIQGGAVVQGLLNYARHTQTEKRAIDLRESIEDSLQMVALKIRLSDIKVQIDIAQDAEVVHGNAVQLQEVFFNIVDNAHYSMTEKKDSDPTVIPTIIFHAKREMDTILLTITDNGMGIKLQDQKKLFTPFFTTKASSRKGNGLGLFVMQKIIQYDHGGKISFQSEYTKGVEIRIVLPVSKSG